MPPSLEHAQCPYIAIVEHKAETVTTTCSDSLAQTTKLWESPTVELARRDGTVPRRLGGVLEGAVARPAAHAAGAGLPVPQVEHGRGEGGGAAAGARVRAPHTEHTVEDEGANVDALRVLHCIVLLTYALDAPTEPPERRGGHPRERQEGAGAQAAPAGRGHRAAEEARDHHAHRVLPAGAERRRHQGPPRRQHGERQRRVQEGQVEAAP
ncbi:hypothetical protein ON010_g16895 [Phytophthora cinnamomi]|nr:hypothetical protein ON010_g16895 [Phytophthora cinnamomi]